MSVSSGYSLSSAFLELVTAEVCDKNCEIILMSGVPNKRKILLTHKWHVLVIHEACLRTIGMKKGVFFLSFRRAKCKATKNQDIYDF